VIDACLLITTIIQCCLSLPDDCLFLPDGRLFLLDVCRFFRVDGSRSALSFVSSGRPRSICGARGSSQALLGVRMTSGE